MIFEIVLGKVTFLFVRNEMEKDIYDWNHKFWGWVRGG